MSYKTNFVFITLSSFKYASKIVIILICQTTTLNEILKRTDIDVNCLISPTYFNLCLIFSFQFHIFLYVKNCFRSWTGTSLLFLLHNKNQIASQIYMTSHRKNNNKHNGLYIFILTEILIDAISSRPLLCGVYKHTRVKCGFIKWNKIFVRKTKKWKENNR